MLKKLTLDQVLNESCIQTNMFNLYSIMHEFLGSQALTLACLYFIIKIQESSTLKQRLYRRSTYENTYCDAHFLLLLLWVRLLCNELRTKMCFQYLGKASNPFCLFFLLHIFFLVILSFGSSTAAASGKSTINIGVVIDEDSRVGKEQKIAMKIAVQNLNNSTKHKLTIHFRNVSAGNPFQAATAG